MTSLQSYQECIHTALLAQLPPMHEQPKQLHEAMHYAVFNGGKRLRPLLVYATGETLGVDLKKLDLPACAVEFIHTYSLIHDDLPAMDDDDWRRGKPACHKAYGEANAIVAGDALQTLAFSCLAQTQNTVFSDKQRLCMIDVLAHASGSRGMAGGQAIDLAVTGQTADLAEIENLYFLKTGALITASIELAIIAAEATGDSVNPLSPCGRGVKSSIFESREYHLENSTIAQLRQYASCIGLAFQIQDDILDIEGNLATLGKEPGSDHKHAKPTYASVAGLAAAKAKVQVLRQQAYAVLDSLDKPIDSLRRVTDLMFF